MPAAGGGGSSCDNSGQYCVKGYNQMMNQVSLEPEIKQVSVDAEDTKESEEFLELNLPGADRKHIVWFRRAGRLEHHAFQLWGPVNQVVGNLSRPVPHVLPGGPITGIYLYSFINGKERVREYKIWYEEQQ